MVYTKSANHILESDQQSNKLKNNIVKAVFKLIMNEQIYYHEKRQNAKLEIMET